MKNLSKVIIAVFFSLTTLFGCVSGSRNADRSEAELLSTLIFHKALADVNILIEIDSVLANGQWTNLAILAGDLIKAPSASWQEQECITICHAEQMGDVYEALLSKYGKGHFQLKIVSNSAGCREIYHRVSGFGDF